MSALFPIILRLVAYGRHTVGVAVLLASFCLGHVAVAQFNWPPNTKDDLIAGQGVQVLNTGAEHVYFRAQTLRVVCWDGVKPCVGWSYSPDENANASGIMPLNSYTGIPDAISDPDVASAACDYSCTQPNNTTFTYISKASPTGYGQVQFETFHYSPIYNIFAHASAAATLAQNGRNPNIDSSRDGLSVITWESDKLIYCACYNMVAHILYPTIVVAFGDNRYGLSQPDVAVNYNGDGVSFVYIATSFSTGKQIVCMKQFDYSTLMAGTPDYKLGVAVLPEGQYGSPRIAAPALGDPVAWAVEAVVAETTSNAIFGLNNDLYNGPISATNLPSVSTLNSIYGPVQNAATCSQPVVSYCASSIDVAWVLTDDRMPQIRNGDQEILQISLDLTGHPTGSDYAIVNKQEIGNQCVPSLAGSFAGESVSPPTVETDRALYCFFDESSSQILYKSLRHNDAYLRVSQTSTTLTQPNKSHLGDISHTSVYPNPFHDQITLMLNPAETVQSAEIYTATGQRIHENGVSSTDTDGMQQVTWNVTNLPTGLYLIRLRTNSGTLYTQRVEHE